MVASPWRRLHSRGLLLPAIVLLSSTAPGLAQTSDRDAVSVRVVDSAGKPVQGAMIAGRFQLPEPIRQLQEPIRQFGFSDEQGAGSINWPAGAEHLKLLARAEGYGLVDHSFSVKQLRAGEIATIQLPPAARISGRLVDAQGRPAAGVRIRPYKIIKYERGRSLAEAIEQAEWVRGLQDDGWPIIEVKPSSEALLPWVETDQDGRFLIDSVAPGQLAGLLAISERTAATTIVVRTDDGPAASIGTERGKPDITIHPREDFEQTLAPSVPVVGRVSEPDPGGAVIGATVSLWRAPVFGFYRAETLLAVRTDVLGKYRLIGMPAGSWRIFVEPGEGQPMVAVERRVEIEATDDVVTLDYTMPRGVMVSGTVTDRNTGEAVPGTISSYVFSDNPHLKPLKPSSLSIDRHSASVDEQGRFEIAVLPGQGILTFEASTSVSQNYRRGIGWDRIDHHIDGSAHENHTMFRTKPTVCIAYNCTQLYEVDIPDVIGTYQIDLVVGEQRTDVPLEFTLADGAQRPSSVYYSSATPDDGSFRLYAPTSSNERWQKAVVSFFAGDKPRVVQARDGNYKLAGWMWVRPDDESATIELKPAATVRGRILRADGTPVADASLGTPFSYDSTTKAGLLPSQPEQGYHPHTDNEGRFEFVGLPGGLPLTIMIDQKDEARNMLLARHYLFEKLELKPGETRDLGELRIDTLREWTRDD